jgi:hypothetical protein
MKYLKLYENFTPLDFNYTDGIRQIIKYQPNELFVEFRPENSENVYNSIKITNNVQHNIVRSAFDDRNNNFIEAINEEGVIVKQYVGLQYDSCIIVPYKELEEWQFESIWENLQFQMKNGELEIHEDFFILENTKKENQLIPFFNNLFID